MAHEGYIYWGRLSRPHGYKGEISLIIENPIEFKKKIPEAVFVEQQGALLPFFLVQVKMSNKGGILALEECTSDTQAKTMYGQEVYVKDTDVKKAQKTVRLEDWIGFVAVDKTLGEIGTIENVMDLPMQQLFVLNVQGHEVLVPAVKDFILKGDNAAKKVFFDLPDGLVDVYIRPQGTPDDLDEEEEETEE